MSEPVPGAPSAWSPAASVAALFAIDPHGTGVVVRAAPGGARDHWLALARACNPDAARWRRVPLHVADHRLLGGLDLAATLRAGRPVAERGLLVEADGSVVVLAMAERIEPAMAARLAAVLDARAVVLERDGITLRTDTSFGVIALDEGVADDEHVARALADRLAFRIDLDALRVADAAPLPFDATTIAEARSRLPTVRAEDRIIAALCATAAALGIASLRVPSLALRAARATAALAGHEAVTDEDAAVAAALVLAPRATRLPVPPQSEDEPADDDEAPPERENPPADPPEANAEPERRDPSAAKELEERVIAAAQAAIPADLLARLRLAGTARPAGGAGGRAGSWKKSQRRGRPGGVRRGELRNGSRLNVIETLRAAAPWQPLRRREALPAAAAGLTRAAAGAATRAAIRTTPGGARPRIEVRREDFRITRYRERTQTTTIFAVDASGSSALHRLGEAKGAVELLLADCYVRRDQVALIAFRGRSAELVLPPTRSLVRARRSLAELPGGGGTPLAHGIESATQLADALRRRGETAVIVLLTDGRGNIARDGRPGREGAEADTLKAAAALRAAGHAVLLVDTSPQPQARAVRLAEAMDARYLALPYADAAQISSAIRVASVGPTAGGRAARSRAS